MGRAEDLYKLMKNPQPGDKELLRRAVEFADAAHKSSNPRTSGESWTEHTFNTGKFLAQWGQTADVIAAGVLHNTINAGTATEATLRQNFGSQIGKLVRGVHDLGMLRYRGLEKHLEALRKLFVAMAKDVRILLIAFANRLDNMHHLSHFPESEQKITAQETLEVHARLAHRLGMGQLKAELETLSFKYVSPEDYAMVEKFIDERYQEALKSIQQLRKSLQRHMAKEDIPIVKTDHRLKNPYSLFSKMKRYENIGKDITRIYDVIALRIIVPDVERCYRALGVIHSKWTPVTGGIKDYIATPKPNGYQSLHTAVLTGDGRVAEIQIRTPEMHENAEFGIAAHFSYKEKGKGKRPAGVSRKIGWAQELVRWQESADTDDDFAHELETDFLKNRIFVFTPNGEVIELPEGATAIDFAYAIHSEIGDTAVAAIINGKYKRLDTPLLGRDTVKIETKKNEKPNEKWLEFAKTAEARRKIKSRLRKRKVRG